MEVHSSAALQSKKAAPAGVCLRMPTTSEAALLQQLHYGQAGHP